jgi:hypothetical protein
MLCASRLSALGVQTLLAEPAGTGGGVAAGPPAPGPALQPEMHDAASASAPSAATQIRLLTANLPLPRSLTGLRRQPALRREGFEGIRTRVNSERGSVRGHGLI